ncbi:hypothetical protein P3G55_22680, partial [Leptospira sp. 96542]|nr:hypothetical protein [Leptospira sp. 96542]
HRGYMGYLLSCGAQHIHNNVLIDDNWCELEWKLKGERTFREVSPWSGSADYAGTGPRQACMRSLPGPLFCRFLFPLKYEKHTRHA